MVLRVWAADLSTSYLVPRPDVIRLGGMEANDMQTTTGTPRPWREWTVMLPALLAVAVTMLLGTLGWLALGLGIGSNCTNIHSCGSGFCAPCRAQASWVIAGGGAQWLLLVAAVVLLIAGLRSPAARRRLAAWAWALTPLAVAWIILAAVVADHSY